jgi:cytochrome c oxidase cbb3-type subunit III
MNTSLRKLAGACVVICVVFAFTAACGRPENPPVLDKDVLDFSALFAENCSGCHGADGKQGPAPVLNSPVYLALVPKDVLRRTIEQGVPGTPMPAFAQSEGGELTPAQIEALASGMEEKWAQPAEMKAVAVPPYTIPDDHPDAAQGKQVFQSACARCHGEGGKAGSITNAAFLGLISDQGLRTSTIVGHPDFGAPDWRGDAPDHALTNQEIGNVVAYLISLRQSAGEARAASVPAVQKQPD